MSRRSRNRWCGIGLAVVVVWLAWATLVPAGGAKDVNVLIPRGASAGRVARVLADNKVIRSAFGFRLLVRITGNASKLKPGAYRFSPGMTPLRVMGTIASGETCARWVTIPEGFTVRQIAKRLASQGLVDEDRFLQLALNGGSSFKTSFGHPASLEGYLFPDTYLIPPGGTEADVIKEMLAAFDKKVVRSLSSDIAGSDLSLQQIVTLASLIEREARVPKDRRLVASVLRNRLAKGMRLQCDATVLYSLGEHKDRVLYRDLEVDSPYNTYQHAGLPPGPIANPGFACIQAALHPADADYLYYVARPDGSHIFSRTLEEHQRAKQIARAEAGR